jgi:2-(1,2-epoxy-1,2-dihydrophenyl)acetyl-CoA isomerase
MSDPQTVLYEVADGIATITLNRPDKLNAYTPEMGDEIVAAFARIREDAEVRAVILTGAGRGFCAGVDLERLAAHRASPDSRRALGEEDFLNVLPLELVEYPKPVIAAINGAAIGVGITMALPCDIRLTVPEAKIGFTFARLGILPGLGSTHLLPRLVGMARAQELILTARVIRGSEAAEIGLVNRSVAPDDLLAVARDTALAMAESDPHVLAAAKRALYYGASASMADAMRNERESSAALRKLRES